MLPSNRVALPGNHFGVASSQEAETMVGKLLALSGDNRRVWNQLTALSMYEML